MKRTDKHAPPSETLSLEGIRPKDRARLAKTAEGMRGWEPVGFTVDIMGDWFAAKHGNRERVVTADCVLTREEAEVRAGEEREEASDAPDDVRVMLVLRKGDAYDTEAL